MGVKDLENKIDQIKRDEASIKNYAPADFQGAALKSAKREREGLEAKLKAARENATSSTGTDLLATTELSADSQVKDLENKIDQIKRDEASIKNYAPADFQGAALKSAK